MSDIVTFPRPTLPPEDHERELWSNFVLAKKKAEVTCDIRDGIAAGKAWAAWLDMFRTICP
ncbi:hypothetical protein [Devosia sp.]|uniref:hypothetical protein n=1 Tax=Devosia sp. TaxID=1871048 RepID=UPI001AC723DB|nr:hypothetical protein [Devosia sp.]MBN9333279.1 hypothetical protein [Devosia sp.]